MADSWHEVQDMLDELIETSRKAGRQDIVIAVSEAILLGKSKLEILALLTEYTKV